MKTDICYVISHGFAARMLLQTGLINQLAQAGKTIAIVTPDPDDENFREFDSMEQVQVYGAQEEHSIWGDDYLFKRRYFLEDIRKNPVLWEKHIHSIFYSKSKHPWKRVRPLYYYLIYKLVQRFPSIRHRFSQNEHRYLKSTAVSALLEKINPKLVVSTYPINLLEAKMLFAAKQQGKNTLIHLLSWDNITSKGKFPMAADYFIVWGKVMYEELQEYYQIPKERIFTCGVPHFDHHIKVKRNPDFQPLLARLGLNIHRPYLFFAMSAPRFAPREIDVVEWMASTVEAGTFGSDMQLVVRPHPQTVQGVMADKSWIKRLQDLNGGKVAVNFPRLNDSKLRWSMQKNDMNYLSNLLAGCSICFNSGSTVSIDALILGKPVIIPSFDGKVKLPYWRSARRLVDYTHLKKFIAYGGAKVVYDYKELKQAIAQYLEAPGLDLERRNHALQKECYKNDGQATRRVVAAIEQVLNGVEG